LFLQNLMNFPADLIDLLRAARHVALFTGAGVSAESGIPTFRDAQTGLWARFRPEDLATPQAFLRDPQTVWNWYAWRRELIAAVRPNPAHLAIAQLERHVPRVEVVTQNVDGLHRAAGSSRVIELHGNIHDTRCFDCGQSARDFDTTGETPPHCAHCGGLLRPGVVWFGETLPAAAWEEAEAAAESADLFFCIGTSSLVEPAAGLPRRAFAAGRPVVQINPEETGHDAYARHVLRGKAGEVMPALLRAAWDQAA
jgi:NAD-dependent deacetylase